MLQQAGRTCSINSLMDQILSSGLSSGGADRYHRFCMIWSILRFVRYSSYQIVCMCNGLRVSAVLILHPTEIASKLYCCGHRLYETEIRHYTYTSQIKIQHETSIVQCQPSCDALCHNPYQVDVNVLDLKSRTYIHITGQYESAKFRKMLITVIDVCVFVRQNRNKEHQQLPDILGWLWSVYYRMHQEYHIIRTPQIRTHTYFCRWTRERVPPTIIGVT